MHRRVKVALVAAVVLVTGALLVQRGTGAPVAQPTVAGDASLGAVGNTDDDSGRRDGRDGTDSTGTQDDNGRKDGGGPSDRPDDPGDPTRDDDPDGGPDGGPDDGRDEDGRDEDGVKQINPDPQTLDGDDGELDDTDDGGGGDDGGDD